MSALTEWNTSPANTRRKQGSPLAYFLVFVFALFIGILVFCYAITERTNPVFLDPHGKPVTESSQPAHH